MKTSFSLQGCFNHYSISLRNSIIIGTTLAATIGIVILLKLRKDSPSPAPPTALIPVPALQQPTTLKPQDSFSFIDDTILLGGETPAKYLIDEANRESIRQEVQQRTGRLWNRTPIDDISNYFSSLEQANIGPIISFDNEEPVSERVLYYTGIGDDWEKLKLRLPEILSLIHQAKSGKSPTFWSRTNRVVSTISTITSIGKFGLAAMSVSNPFTMAGQFSLIRH
ncbi:MAG: hypothetical protein K940chlam8_00418 [Chlamydiae bacterium]|nr:hypothetical protein [Chlamydiota bacterium]